MILLHRKVEFFCPHFLSTCINPCKSHYISAVALVAKRNCAEERWDETGDDTSARVQAPASSFSLFRLIYAGFSALGANLLLYLAFFTGPAAGSSNPSPDSLLRHPASLESHSIHYAHCGSHGYSGFFLTHHRYNFGYQGGGCFPCAIKRKGIFRVFPTGDPLL